MTTTKRDHCCTDTPLPPRDNPPGQTHLRTRVGTWAQFRARMIAGLTTQQVTAEGETDARRPLQALTTRESDDGTIALIDTWAAACDVLAFYGERILEEGYLGTAKHRGSVVEIARSLGYEPRPGVAASCRLALEIQQTPLTADTVALEAGLAVMSVPPEGAKPQIFETTEPLSARAEYNKIAARQTIPQRITGGVSQIWLEGVATRLEPGQRMVIAHPNRDGDASRPIHVARVQSVDVDLDSQRTRIAFTPSISGLTTANPLVLVFRQRAGIFGWNAPDFVGTGPDVQLQYVSMIVLGPGAEELVWAPAQDWPGFSVGAGNEPDTGGVHLDRETDAVAVDSFVFLEDHDSSLLGQVTAVAPVGRADWTLSGRVSNVSFDATSPPMSSFSRRGTAVHIASEALAISAAPDPAPVEGHTVDLAEAVTPMEPGRAIIVRGTTVGGEPFVLQTEVAQWDTIAGVQQITLADEIDTPLQRSTVHVLANVVLASHGQSVRREVVGSGDATAFNQRFVLRQGPLTWTSAANPSGVEASVVLRIDGVQWGRVDSLVAAGPNDRVYVVETLEDGRVEIVLGDGVRGSRAPTGIDNVVVDYRIGIGLEGELDADRISLLQSRPQGLFAATNPAPARGAADPETIADARTHAPLHVMTLDRLVSLTDYGDYARAFPGIGKARATELWDGHRAWIQLTVATASGEPLAATDPLMETLRAAIASASDPTHVVRVAGHLDVSFSVAARLATDPAYVRAEVEARVVETLTHNYSFALRAFGQPVPVSEVAAAIHGVEGVVAVDVDAVTRDDGVVGSPAVVRAALPKWTGSGTVSHAELLLVRPTGISLTEMPR